MQSRWHVLDTSVLLQGGERPPGPCATTPQAVAELGPGGRDRRRLDYWLASGLEVREPDPRHVDDVRNVAAEAGNLGRLSEADVSLLALTVSLQGTLWSDDKTMLDVARRLGAPAHAVREGGIAGTLDFRPRCAGCGRWWEKEGECAVCGSPVRLRPTGPATRRG